MTLVISSERFASAKRRLLRYAHVTALGCISSVPCGCGDSDTSSDLSDRAGASGVVSGGTSATGGAAANSAGGALAGATSSSGATSNGGALAGANTSAGAAASGGATSRGGSNSGGTASGGSNSGGRSSSGGASAGSTASAGASNGGASAGGAASAGASNGGASAGSAASAGASNGGASAGGAFALDCGGNGWAVEAHGPPENRVNYAIIGDGYSSSDLAPGGVFEQHINKAMAKRFSIPIGEPYSRYRNFVNICAIKLVSNGAICSGSSALNCCGDDQSRLAKCDNTAANNALKTNLPASFVLDWKAVVLNGKSWWNTGAALMLWSGGHTDAAGAALHEGGHGFHQLADEYGGTNSGCTNEYAEVNSTANANTTSGKWDLWLQYNQAGATGLQSAVQGSRYCNMGQYRPSSNSMMNQLFGNNPNTSYNSVSREQIVFTIWRAVVPIDSTNPPAGAVSSPKTLSVRVIDPAVIDVDWSVDGNVVATKGGESFDVAAHGLAAGMHTVTAKAYDNAGDDLVRYRSGTCPSSVTGNYCARAAWNRSQQTVTWTVSVP